MLRLRVADSSSARLKAVTTTAATLKTGEVIEVGGIDDYELLRNKPSINSVTLIGNKTSTDLGLQDELDYADFTDIDDMFYGI